MPGTRLKFCRISAALRQALNCDIDFAGFLVIRNEHHRRDASLDRTAALEWNATGIRGYREDTIPPAAPGAVGSCPMYVLRYCARGIVCARHGGTQTAQQTLIKIRTSFLHSTRVRGRRGTKRDILRPGALRRSARKRSLWSTKSSKVVPSPVVSANRIIQATLKCQPPG